MIIFTEHFWQAVVASLVFGILGPGMVVGWCWLLNKLTPSIDFAHEIKEKNVAAALVAVGFMMAVAVIIFGVTN